MVGIGVEEPVEIDHLGKDPRELLRKLIPVDPVIL
jgi:hypothetical protein